MTVTLFILSDLRKSKKPVPRKSSPMPTLAPTARMQPYIYQSVADKEAAFGGLAEINAQQTTARQFL